MKQKELLSLYIFCRDRSVYTPAVPPGLTILLYHPLCAYKHMPASVTERLIRLTYCAPHAPSARPQKPIRSHVPCCDPTARSSLGWKRQKLLTLLQRFSKF